MPVISKNILFTNKTLTAGSTVLSHELDLNTKTGNFSLGIKVSGLGSLTVSYLTSTGIKGVDSHEGLDCFIKPSKSDYVFFEFKQNDGENKNGYDLQGFEVELTDFIKLEFIESSGSFDIEYSAVLFYS